MIKYQLHCARGHEFEGWFSSSADYDAQAAEDLLSCPHCGDRQITKAVMAPAIVKNTGVKAPSKVKEKIDAAYSAAQHQVNVLRDYVEKNFDNVGEKFPEEARKIHYGEAEKRGIYGEASIEECQNLVEEGVEVAPLAPPTPKPEKLN